MKLSRFLLFNPFVTLYLYSDPFFLRWNRRLKACVLEVWYNLSVFLPYMIFIPIITDAASLNSDRMRLLASIPFGIQMLIILNKDFFGGQSVVHRTLGYQVIDIKTTLPASKLKCMLRNITAPLWPIEIIMILVNPQRRVGDFIAGTILIETNPSDAKLIVDEMQNVKFDRQTALTLLFSTIWISFMITTTILLNE